MAPPRAFSLLTVVFALAQVCLAQTTLTNNSGINSSDTYVLFDLSVTLSSTLTTQYPVYNSSTGQSSTTVPLSTSATYHVQAGYDPNGQPVIEMWPTGSQPDPTQADVSDISMIRLAGGQVYVFDQSGNLIPWTQPGSNAPLPVPLEYLGSNPAQSVLVGMVVSNVPAFASARGATAVAEPRDCQGPCGSSTYLVSAPMSTGRGGTLNTYYALSGSNYVLYRAAFTPTEPNETVTATLDFSNVTYSDNATADQGRANQANTASAPPAMASGNPPATGSTPNCGTAEFNLGGSQDLLLQHGLFSGPCTWNRMYPWLADDLRLGNVLIPQLSWADRLSDQVSQQEGDITSYGIQNGIYIGHSQGGLVSRSAAQFFVANPSQHISVNGVITLDSPNQGAPLAVTGVAEAAQGIEELGGMLWNDTGCALQYNPWCFAAYIAYNNALWLTWGGLYSAIPALEDLVPGSQYLQNLNAQNETFTRVGIASQPNLRWMPMRLFGDFLCNPDDFCGGRAMVDYAEAVYDYANLLYVYSQLSGDFTDAEYYFTVIDDMNNIDAFWFFMAGGPSDGIVPNGSQSYPNSGATQYIIGKGDSHLGATRSDKSRTFLDAALRQQFFVPTQASCTFGITASPATLPVSSGSGYVSTSAGSGCGWSLTSDAAWLTLSADSGNSSETVNFNYAANPTTALRHAHVTVSNGDSSATVEIDQDGVCTYSLGYTTAYLPNTGDPGGYWDNVTTSNDECVWTALPRASWLSTTNQTGTGSAGFYFMAIPNTNSANLAGTVDVMGQELTVLEGGTGGTSSTGSLSVSGYEASAKAGCPYHCYTVYETETISITIGGVTVRAGASRYGNNTASAVASAVANVINGSVAMPVSASVSGSTVALTSKLHGGGTDYSISVSYSWNSPFSSPDFYVSGSGMTGGS